MDPLLIALLALAISLAFNGYLAWVAREQSLQIAKQLKWREEQPRVAIDANDRSREAWHKSEQALKASQVVGKQLADIERRVSILMNGAQSRQTSRGTRF